MSKTKFHKVGQLLMKKDKSGEYMTLGRPNDKKYAYSVAIKIFNANGEEVYLGQNPMIMIQDPRKRPGITEEQAAKIPDFVVADLVIVDKEED